MLQAHPDPYVPVGSDPVVSRLITALATDAPRRSSSHGETRNGSTLSCAAALLDDAAED